ncbi:MAG TPA: hypothetical protein PLT82_09620 [Candidatus Hydrogenedens sp.]|nr:hypothetical protein [Candidatus Hydrogenedens sp.]HOL19518.1 hypothetical protein [Candidatus Hydrogenedens sp.]HPP59378.1 hypothetical protein [Candidatus Hydrogenedens sp.]
MPEPKDMELRIYCICGQKMRVQPDMYGRPGRCVACRQKIRIPHRDELPEGITEIYLKDHPEFLRRKSTKDKSEVLGDSSPFHDKGSSDSDYVSHDILPLESLEFLQILISAEYKAQKNLHMLRQKKPVGKETKPDLLGYLSKIRRMRADLDEKIKIRRSETLEQLKQIEDEIGELVVSYRTGSIDFNHYWRRIVPLRIRRERLFRRRKNLEGWLSTVSPELAGGYVDVDLTKLSDRVPDIVFPLSEEENNTSVLSILIEGLQKSISSREELERRFIEWKKVVEAGKVNNDVARKGIAEYEAKLKIAHSAISFYRERLDQLALDCDLDLESIEKNIDRIQKQKEAKIIDAQTARHIEESLFQARLDLSKTRDTARRAISANSQVDIPSLQGTFVARIGPSRGAIEIGRDSWIAWFCSTLIIMLIMIPMTSSQGLVSSKVLILMVVGLFLSAILLAIAGSIPYRRWRGIALNLLWVIYVVGYTIYINLTWYSLTPLGGQLRVSSNGLFSLSIVSVYVVLFLIGVASWLSVYKEQGMKWIPLCSTILNVLFVFLILSDFFGVAQGNVILGAAGRMNYVSNLDAYQVEISLYNKGLRSVWIGNDLAQVPAPVFVKVYSETDEKKEYFPYEAKIGGKERLAFEKVFNQADGKVPPKREAFLYYQLPSGTYIVKLLGEGPIYQPKQIRLVLPEQKKDTSQDKPVDANQVEIKKENQAVDSLVETQETNISKVEGSIFEELSDTEASNMRLSSGELLVFFHGFAQVTNGSGENSNSPKFRISIRTSDSNVSEKFANLGERIAGDWILSEFSQQRETITLNYKGKIFIAKIGKYYKLQLND